VTATILTRTVVITSLCYELFSSQMPRIRNRTNSKPSWRQGQLIDVLAVVKIERKILDVGLQFDIHKANVRNRLKLNLTGSLKQL
jgi:hypothetical protein